MESCHSLLARHFGVLTFLIALAFLAVVAGMVLSVKMKLPKPLPVFLACCLLVLILPSIHIVMGFMDLHEKDYVVYCGDFTVSERHELNGNLTLHDSERTRVRMRGGDFLPPDGEYAGYVVYSKRTRLLLAYDPYEDPLATESAAYRTDSRIFLK